MMTGNDDRNPDLSEEQDTTRTGMDIQLVQTVFGNDSLDVDVQPDCYPYLLDKTDSPEVYADMAGKQVIGRGKE